MSEDRRHYEIEIKQGDLLIQLCSDDVYFISKQMDKWFRILLDDRYVPISIPPTPILAPPSVAPPPAETAPASAPVVEAAPVPTAAPKPTAAAPVIPEPAPPPVVPTLEPTPAPVVPEAAATEPQPASLDVAVQDDFEAVMDTLMRDLEQGAEESPAAVIQASLGVEMSTAAVLETAAPGPKIDLSVIDSLAELCERSRASTSEDYLILTAYFLTYFEGVDKFSLKRVNSLLVKSGLTPVNHSVLETAMTKDFLVLVPDLTGMADISEYSLSEAGQQQANKLIS